MSRIPKRKPLPKIVSSLLSDKEMRKKLREHGLSSQGNRQVRDIWLPWLTSFYWVLFHRRYRDRQGSTLSFFGMGSGFKMLVVCMHKPRVRAWVRIGVKVRYIVGYWVEIDQFLQGVWNRCQTSDQRDHLVS